MLTGWQQFFRWMSERYPTISQLIADNRIPEFDCLYVCDDRSVKTTHTHQQLTFASWT